MNALEYNEFIQQQKVIGGLTWKYEGKYVFADILEIEREFEGEYFFRIRSHQSMPLVRVLIGEKSTRIYFLTERSNSGELDWPEFETSGLKCTLSLN